MQAMTGTGSGDHPAGGPRDACRTGIPGVGELGHGFGAILRRYRPAPIADGRAEGSHVGEFELICFDCGDNPGLESSVAVFIDGIRVGSSTTGQAAWADLPTSAFDRVEVISGPAAASFGADAVGGVVQLFTNRAANQPNQTTISTGGGSNKTFDTQIRTSGSISSAGPLSALAGLKTH